MKNFNGYTGGHPLTLSNLLFIQEAAKEVLINLARTFVPPSITTAFLDGCVITEGVGETSITDGWMLYAGDLYRVPAKTVAVTGLNNLKLVLVTGTPTGYPADVLYQTSGTKEVYKETVLDLRDTGDPDGEGAPIVLDTYVYRVTKKPRRTGEMFFPEGPLSDYFNLTTGIGKGECLGYGLCDGQDGRPDLKERFLVGLNPANAAYDNVGDIGGTASETLGITQIPIHNHDVTDPGHGHSIIDPQHSHGSGADNGAAFVHASGGANTDTGGPQRGLDEVSRRYAPNTASSTTGISIQNNTTGISTNNKGGGLAHNNLPPFYTVVFMIQI